MLELFLTMKFEILLVMETEYNDAINIILQGNDANKLFQRHFATIFPVLILYTRQCKLN